MSRLRTAAVIAILKPNVRGERRAKHDRSSARLEVGGSLRNLSRKADDYAALEKRDRFAPRAVRHVSPEPPFILAAKGKVDLVALFSRKLGLDITTPTRPADSMPKLATCEQL